RAVVALLAGLEIAVAADLVLDDHELVEHDAVPIDRLDTERRVVLDPHFRVLEAREAAVLAARAVRAVVREPGAIGLAAEERLPVGPARVDVRGAVERRAAAARHDVDRAEPVGAAAAADEIVVDDARPLVAVVVPDEDDVDSVLLEDRPPGAPHRQ